jgi:hypothetical protein
MELTMSNDNKYLTKVCALLRAPEPPRSEKAVHRPKRIKKPKLQRFVSKITGYSTKPKSSY